MIKKRTGIIILMIFSLLIGGCFNSSLKQKEYSSHGFNIKMDDDMALKDIVSTTVSYMNDKAAVSALREEFSILETVGLSSSSTISDYAAAVIESNNNDYELKEKDGLNYFEYEQAISGKDYHFYVVIYKSEDAFWLVTFTCDKKHKNEYQDKFFKWAKTVTFNK